MPTKSVLVRLRGDNGDLNRALLGSAAAADVLHRNLDDADDSSRRLSDSLETSNDRTTMLIQSALALGPSLVPLGAQAVPVIAGLTAELGAAAAAAGVTALAFWGVGDAVKAVRDYQLQPTEAHLQKMQETLDALGPAGRDFVHYISELRPQLQGLQDIAQAGMLPGVEDSIEMMLTRLPEVERVISTIATTLGQLSREAGKSLAGPEWDDFFTYIETDARPLLLDLSRTAGNVVLGFANMMQAFGPMSRGFSDGLLEMSRSFAAWSADLENSQGFHDFVAYIERTGPKVWDTLGALANAMISIAEAAAPVGEVSLPVIQALANALSIVASSPAGPVLIGAAAGISAISRAIALFEAANGSAAFQTLTGGRKLSGGSTPTFAAASAGGTTSIRATIPAIREYQSAVVAMRTAESEAAVAHARYLGTLRASSLRQELIPGAAVTKTMTSRVNELQAANIKSVAASQRLAEAERVKATALRESGIAAGKAAGLIGALALTSSGVSDKVGLSNTAMLTMMGTMAGGWGAAIGAGVGLTMDFAAANNDLESAIAGANQAMQSMNVDQMKSSLDSLNTQIDATNDKLNVSLGFNPVKNFGELMSGTMAGTNELFSGSLDKAKDKRAELERSITDAAEAAARATIDTDAYTGAVGRSGIAAGLTASEVNGLAAAMTEQRSATLGAFDAVTQYRTALKAARAQGEKTNAGIKGSSDEALQNRQLISQLAAAWNNQSDAVRNSVQKYRAARAAFIETAVAMGVPIEKARELAKSMLEIPNKRVVEVAMTGADAAISQLRRIKAEVTSIPRTWSTTYYVTQVNRINKVGSGANQPVPQASGGFVPKTGLPYADRWHYLLADGEGITRNDHGQTDNFRDVVAAINAGYDRASVKGMLAAGGIAGHPRYIAPPQPAGSVQVQVARQSLDGVRVEGRVDMDPSGPMFRGVIRDEIAADKRFDRVKAGR